MLIVIRKNTSKPKVHNHQNKQRQYREGKNHVREEIYLTSKFILIII